METVIGGLDIGSTGAKITVVGADGAMLHGGYRDYPVSRGEGAHELHGDAIWDAVKELLREAAGAAPSMSAVGITTFGESFTLLDGNGGVLMPSMLYTDPRGAEESAELREAVGYPRVCSIAGGAPQSMYSLPKLMWVRKRRPELLEKTKYICLIEDFLGYRLTGRRLIDYSLAARTMGFDIKNKRWSGEIFGAAGIDPGLFSEPVPSGTAAGPVLPEIAAELGVSPDLQIVLCCHDQVAAAAGSGVLRPGEATDGAGTVQCVTPVFAGIPGGGVLYDNHYALVPFLRDNTYCTYAFSYTGGSLIKWFIDTLAGKEKAEAKARGLSVYDYLESFMEDEPGDILALPHFAGAATPYMDGGAKGAFVGLGLTTRIGQMYRACMEGIAYEMAVNAEKLKEGRIEIKNLRATGGCAASRLWLQMKADILDIPVTRMSVDEAGTVGGIMLTGVATGVYESLESAAEILVRPLETFYPRADMHEKYMKIYERYKKLYYALRPLT